MTQKLLVRAAVAQKRHVRAYAQTRTEIYAQPDANIAADFEGQEGDGLEAGMRRGHIQRYPKEHESPKLSG